MMVDGVENAKRLGAFGQQNAARRMRQRMACALHHAHGHQADCSWCKKFDREAKAEPKLPRKP